MSLPESQTGNETNQAATASGGEQSQQQVATTQTASTAVDAAANASSTGNAGVAEKQGDAQGGMPDASKANGSKGEAPPKTALENVKRVMDAQRKKAAKDAGAKTDEASPAASSNNGDPKGADSNEGKDGSQDEDLTGRIDESEWNAIPERTRKRITQFRGQVREARRTIEAMKPKAETYDNLHQYLGQSGLSREDFVEALELSRLVKQDPAAAYKRMQPILEQLRRSVGDLLPDDLEQEVSSGLMSRERATELAAMRMAQERQKLQTEEQRRADEERQQHQAVQEVQRQAVDALRALEGQWRQSDPDYAKKAELIWERMRVMMQDEQKPLTRENITDIATRAKKDVDKRVSSFAPPPRSITPVPTGGHANVTATPKTALEAATLAARRSA